MAVDARAASPPDAPLSVSVDGDPPSRVALLPDRRVWLAVPAREKDGVEVRLSPSGPAVVNGLVVDAPPEKGRALFAGLAIALMSLMLLRALKAAEAAGLGLFAAGGVALACMPGWILLAWPGTARRPASPCPPSWPPVASRWPSCAPVRARRSRASRC